MASGLAGDMPSAVVGFVEGSSGLPSQGTNRFTALLPPTTLEPQRGCMTKPRVSAQRATLGRGDATIPTPTGLYIRGILGSS